MHAMPTKAGVGAHHLLSVIGFTMPVHFGPADQSCNL
jgi:hypothetical protein